MRKMRILLIAFLLSACSCGPPKRIVTGEPIQRGFYAYVKVSDATFHVLAVNQQYLELALREIGCVAGTICLVEQRGEFFVVQQQRDIE